MSSIKALVPSRDDETPREERTGNHGGRWSRGREVGVREGLAKRRKKISHSKRASALRENGARWPFRSTERRAEAFSYPRRSGRASILILFSRKLRAIFAKPGRAQVCPRRLESRRSRFAGRRCRLRRCQLTLIGAQNGLLLLIAGPGNLSRAGRNPEGAAATAGRPGEGFYPFLRLYLDANSVVNIPGWLLSREYARVITGRDAATTTDRPTDRLIDRYHSRSNIIILQPRAHTRRISRAHSGIWTYRPSDEADRLGLRRRVISRPVVSPALSLYLSFLVSGFLARRAKSGNARKCNAHATNYETRRGRNDEALFWLSKDKRTFW